MIASKTKSSLKMKLLTAPVRRLYPNRSRSQETGRLRVDSDAPSRHVPPMDRVHGTCVAVEGVGVLLRGCSGRGKSDLALRLIEAGCRLVSDDYALVEATSDGLQARAPEALMGLLEVRGIGIVHLSALPSISLRLVIDLVAPESVERMPLPEMTEIEGIALPVFHLWAFEASAVAKVHLVVRIVTRGIMRLP